MEFKEHHRVILPTENDSPFTYCSYSNNFALKTGFEKKECCKNHHLYILSNDNINSIHEVSDGTWVYDAIEGIVFQVGNNGDSNTYTFHLLDNEYKLYFVIASTNPQLNLPIIRMGFLENWLMNMTSKVMVEYEFETIYEEPEDSEDMQDWSREEKMEYYSHPLYEESCFKLTDNEIVKVYPDNTINIKIQNNTMNKENFTREEVIDIIQNLLERPDMLIDAVSNENTDWSSETLLELVENE